MKRLRQMSKRGGLSYDHVGFLWAMIMTCSGFLGYAERWMSFAGSTRFQLAGVVTVFGAFARHAGKRQPSPSIFDLVDCFHHSSRSLRRESTASVIS